MGQRPPGLAQLKGGSCKDPGHRRPGGWSGRKQGSTRGCKATRANVLLSSGAGAPLETAAGEEPTFLFPGIPPHSPALKAPAPQGHETLDLVNAFLPAPSPTAREPGRRSCTQASALQGTHRARRGWLTPEAPLGLQAWLEAPEPGGEASRGPASADPSLGCSFHGAQASLVPHFTDLGTEALRGLPAPRSHSCCREEPGFHARGCRSVLEGEPLQGAPVSSKQVTCSFYRMEGDPCLRGTLGQEGSAPLPRRMTKRTCPRWGEGWRTSTRF